MADNVTYLLDLNGVKTLYDEIMKDIHYSKPITVPSYQDLSALTDEDLQDTDTVILVCD